MKFWVNFWSSSPKIPTSCLLDDSWWLMRWVDWFLLHVSGKIPWVLKFSVLTICWNFSLVARGVIQVPFCLTRNGSTFRSNVTWWKTGESGENSESVTSHDWNSFFRKWKCWLGNGERGNVLVLSFAFGSTSWIIYKFWSSECGTIKLTSLDKIVSSCGTALHTDSIISKWCVLITKWTGALISFT